MSAAIPQNIPQAFLIPHTKIILQSYKKWTGKDLIPYHEDPAVLVASLFHAPFVVATSDAAADPILNYGNQKALDLWEMSWEKLTKTPGRQTAEPVHQAKRDEFLKAVKENGFVDNYSGIRISSTGKRFEIKCATVWNLLDESGKYYGQAATFSQWQYI